MKKSMDSNTSLVLIRDLEKRLAKLETENAALTLQNQEKEKQLKALNDERTLFRTIIDLIPDAVYVKDAGGRKILANPKEVNFSGKNSEDEIIGKTDYDLYPEDQAGSALREDLFILETGNPVLDVDGKLVDKDGKRHWLLVSKMPLRDSCGNITGIVGITRDNTHRKNSEDEKTRQLGLINSLLDSIPDLIFFKDPDGVYLGCNPTFAAFAGKTKNEIIGKTDHDLFEKEAADFFRYYDMEMLKEKLPRHNEESITWPDGKNMIIDTLKTPYWANDGSLIGILGISRNITERRQTEDELKQVYTRLTLATRAGGVGVWDLDLVSNTLVWDEQMFALYGVAKENFGGAYETWLSGVHPDDWERCDAEIGMAIRGEKEFDTEFRVCWPDGSVRNIRALATILNDDSGIPGHMIGTNWDITEQKNTEEKLLKAIEDAKTANKAKSMFLASMSHEIRTPLNSIIGFSQLMGRDHQLSDLQKEYNAIIIRAGEHLLSLINDILELSKAEAGRLGLNPVNVDLKAFFTDIRMMFAEPARSKHLQFIFETADNLPRYAIVDEIKLRRLFINLIGNALKFTEEGSIVVNALYEKTDQETGRLIVNIRDSGPGIPESELGKLFKRFEQTSAGIKKSSGTGLGLVLSRELATLMGGNITVESKVGSGSVFTFIVELKTGDSESTIGKNTKRVKSIDTGQEACRILVADDNEINLKVSVKLLQLLGFETMEAVNGVDAVAKFEEWDPHLILMDMQMPVMDGFEATRLIKSTEKGKHTPIIALTASLFEEDRKKMLMFGLDDCILKPFSENELLGTIGKMLDVKYIYEESKIHDVQEPYLHSDGAIGEDLDKLPKDLVLQLKDAVESANFDLLIKLIDTIEPENSGLARRLVVLANNYDYDYLQKILTRKETTK